MAIKIGSSNIGGIRAGTYTPERIYLGSQVIIAPFDPADVNAELWFDPSDLSSLWINTAGTTPVTADADLVGRMNNKGSAGSGMNALQGTSSLKPQYKTSGGLHWLLPDGVDDFLLAGNISNMMTATDFDLMVAFTANTIGTDSAIVQSNDPVWGQDAAWCGMHYRTTGPTLYAYNFDTNADSAGVAFSAATAYVARQRHSGGNIYISVNGGAETSAASGDTGSIATALKLFGRAGVAFSDLKFFGMVCRKTTFTAGEAASLNTWLGAKAGLTI